MSASRQTSRTADKIAQKRKELAPYMRGLIVGATASGQSGTRIAEHLNIPRSTVYDTLHLDFARNDGQSRVRRPKAYTDLDLGKLLRHVQLHPTETYEQIKNALGLPYSATTIKAMLKAHGVTHKRIASSQKRFVKNSSPAVAVSAAD
jgi:transposase